MLASADWVGASWFQQHSVSNLSFLFLCKHGSHNMTKNCSKIFWGLGAGQEWIDALCSIESGRSDAWAYKGKLAILRRKNFPSTIQTCWMIFSIQGEVSQHTLWNSCSQGLKWLEIWFLISTKSSLLRKQCGLHKIQTWVNLKSHTWLSFHLHYTLQEYNSWE